MTLIMAFVGVMRNYGFGEDWVYKFLRSWSVMASRSVCLPRFIIIPQARKISRKSKHTNYGNTGTGKFAYGLWPRL